MNKKIAHEFSHKLIIEELEARQLFSIGLESLAVAEPPSQSPVLNIDIASTTNSTAQANTPPVAASPAEVNTQTQTGVRQELILVDTDVKNYQELLNDIYKQSDAERNIQVVLLDNNSDGIQQITQALCKQNNLDAVHLITNGSDGALDLGNSQLTSANLVQNQAAISKWRNAFAEQGDLLIYGSDVAASKAGQALINTLSELTGADVAASNNATGLNGDWNLEYATGSIETAVAPSSAVQQSWIGTLTTVNQNAIASLITPLLPSANAGTAEAVITHEIAFVDTQVNDYQQLVDDLKQQSNAQRQIETVLLDASQDGIRQISATLQNRHDLEAIHIFSHGVDGAVELGSAWLNSYSLETRADAIAQWKSALSQNADIMLYGCDVAADAQGLAFINRLGKLTGADVAASEDATGNAALGGNWNLEYSTGSIETKVVIDAQTQQEWAHLMAITVDTTSSAMTTGATSLTFTHTITSGSNGILIVNISLQAASSTVTSVTYGGTALTLLGSEENMAGAHTRSEMWYLKTPATGMANVVVTINASKAFTAGATNFFGVDQTTPTGTFTSATGVGYAPDVTLSSAAGELVIDALAQRSITIGTVGTGQTELYHQFLGTSGGDTWASSSTETGAASVSMTWSISGSGPGEWAIGAVSLKPVLNTALTLGNGTLAAVDEDTANPAGQMVSAIFSVQFTDPDAGSSFGGIAVVGNTANAGTEGIWQYSANSGSNWFAIGTVADNSSALALSSSALIRFVPVANYNGAPPTLTVRGLDNTYVGGFSTTVSSETRVTVSTTTNGSLTAIAAAAANLSTSIMAVNDAPGLPGVFLGSTNEDVAMTLLVSTFSSGSSDNDTSALKGLAIVGIDNSNGQWQYTLNGTNWVDIVGAATNTALLLAADATSAFRFVPNSNWNGTTGMLQYKAWDQTSGSAGTYVDASVSGGTTAFSGTSGSSLTVNAVNDAPIASGGTTLASALEDALSPSGATVSSLFAGDFSDLADGGNPGQNQFVAVGARGQFVNAAKGRWQYSINSGTSWNNFGLLNDTNALTLGLNDSLRFLPAANYNGTPNNLTVRLIDNSTLFKSGAAIDMSTRGGTTAFSIVTVAATTSITPVADTPAVTNATTSEDTQSTSALVISRNAADGAEVTNFKITGISNGMLYKNDGTTQIANGTFITFTEGNAGLKFTPMTNFNGSGSFTIQASTSNIDAGLGGSTVNALITVTPVNDAPTATHLSASESYNEDTVLNLTNIVVSDVDNANITATLTLSDVAAGSLNTGSFGSVTSTLVAGVWSASGAVSDVNTLLSGLTFTPSLNFNSNFTIAASVSDAVAAALVGTKAMTGIVVNDAPTTTPVTLAPISEDSGTRLITQAELLVNAADVDGPVLAATGLTINSGSGSLVDNGNGSWNYTPVLNDDTQVSFSYSVTDGSLTATGSATLDITPVNDVPRLVNAIHDQAATGGTAFSFTFAANSFADVDAGDTLSYNASALPIWLNFNTVTRTFSGSPSNADVGSVTVSVTASDSSNAGISDNFDLVIGHSNVAPLATRLNAAESYTEDTALILSTIVISDVDGVTATATLTLSDLAAGSLNTGTAGSVTSTFAAGVWTASGVIADVNTLLSGLTFTPSLNYNSSFTIATRISDGVATDVIGTKAMLGTAVNDAPSGEVTMTSAISNDATTGTQGNNIVTTVITPVPFALPLSSFNVMASSVIYSVNQVAVIAPNSATVFADNTASLSHKVVTAVSASKDVVISSAAPDQQSQAASTSSEQQTVIAQTREHSMAAKFKDFQASSKPDYPVDMEHVFTQGEQQALWQRLNSLRQQIDQSELHHHALEIDIVVVSTVSLTAGFVSWALRGGILMASLLPSVPLLKRFDPLPIFIAAKKSATADQSEYQQHSDQDVAEDKVEQLFSQAACDEVELFRQLAIKKIPGN